MSDSSGRTSPAVSLDEALALFLTYNFPQGLPEGVDREALLRRLREQVAAERPEWAAASAPPQAPVPSEAASDYARMKELIAHQAQQPEVPTDEHERYLYERAQEARRSRERRQQEQRETEAREALMREVLARKALLPRASGPDRPELTPASVAMAPPQVQAKGLSLPQVQAKGLSSPQVQAKGLSSPRVQAEGLSSPQVQAEGLSSLRVQAEGRASPALRPSPQDSEELRVQQEALRLSQVLLERTRAMPMEVQRASPREEARPAPAPSRLEVAEALRSLTPEEQLRLMQGFNASRRANMKKREELLTERRPSRSASRGEPLSLSDHEGPVRQGLSVDERPARARHATAFRLRLK